MSDTYEDENDVFAIEEDDDEDEFVEVGAKHVQGDSIDKHLAARRRLESLLEERLLKSELEDYMDY